MAVNFVSCFGPSHNVCYGPNYEYPVITGTYDPPSKHIAKNVVRIPPSYGSGAYYSRQATSIDGVYCVLDAGHSPLRPTPCVNHTGYGTADNPDSPLFMYSDGVFAECYTYNYVTHRLRYWRIRWIRTFQQKQYTYFECAYYFNTNMAILPEQIDAYVTICRQSPEYSWTTAVGTANDSVYQETSLVGVDDWLEPFLWYDLTGVLTQPFAGLARSAYNALIDNLPATATNSVANVLEVASGLRKLLANKPLSLDPRDIWLAYRYSYSTTKADLQEYISLTNRLSRLPDLKDITVRSIVSHENTVCRCTATISCDSIIPKSTADWLRTYGFRLSAANAWDMLPYSFVVDWFLHISDFLSEIDKMEQVANLPMRDVWYSFKKTVDGCTTYFRVPGKAISCLPLIGVTTHKASDKTICYRIADSIALFTR